MIPPYMVCHSLGAFGCLSAAHPFTWLLLVTPFVDCLHVAPQPTSPSCFVGALCAVINLGPVVLA